MALGNHLVEVADALRLIEGHQDVGLSHTDQRAAVAADLEVADDRSAALGHAVDLAADHRKPLADRHPTQDSAGEEDALAAYPDDDVLHVLVPTHLSSPPSSRWPRADRPARTSRRRCSRAGRSRPFLYARRNAAPGSRSSRCSSGV